MTKDTRSTTERGYGAQHQAEKRRYQDQLISGATYRCTCRRTDCPHHTNAGCTVIITAATPWDLGHDDTNRTRYRGPECIPCNRSAGARAKQGKPTLTLRTW